MALKKKAQTKTETPVQNEAIEGESTVVEETQTEQASQETTPVVEKDEPAQEIQTKESPASTAVVERESTAIVGKANPSGGSVGGVAEYVKQAADAGFEDMDLGGFGTFPILVLGTDGKFECEDEDWGDDSFIGQVNKTKAVYLCKQEGVNDGPCAYTYDQVNLNSPQDGATTVEDLRTAWKEEGYDLEIKAYLEVLIEIVQEGHDREGEFFIVKLPPSSANNFKGKHFIANSKFGVELGQVCIEFGVGKKRTSGSNKYYPWKFSIVK